nr:MAG TPA: hypothetical protein [Caudoviricetes sp.]
MCRSCGVTGMHDKDRDVFKRHETTQNRMRTR